MKMLNVVTTVFSSKNKMLSLFSNLRYAFDGVKKSNYFIFSMLRV